MIKILTEGNKQKGYGHIYRCLTIVSEFDASLYIDSEEDLTSIYSKSIMCSWQNVEWVTANVFSDDTVIIDSYHVGIDVLNTVKEIAKKCIVIDDLMRLDYKNFTILNPNNFGTDLNYDSSNVILSGSKYMLTRKEFNNQDRGIINQEVSNIFVMIGATDILNISQKLYDFFNNDSYFSNVNITMVSGSSLKSTNNIKIVSGLDGEQICDLMMQCDFAITAGGQTLNELIKTKTPFTCIEVASNQRSNIDGILSKEYGMEFTIDKLDDIKKMFNWDLRFNFYNNMKEVNYQYNGAHYLKCYLEVDYE